MAWVAEFERTKSKWNFQEIWYMSSWYHIGALMVYCMICYMIFAYLSMISDISYSFFTYYTLNIGCLMYDVWCMMYDVWCMMYDVWCMVRDWYIHPRNLHPRSLKRMVGRLLSPFGGYFSGGSTCNAAEIVFFSLDVFWRRTIWARQWIAEIGMACKGVFNECLCSRVWRVWHAGYMFCRPSLVLKRGTFLLDRGFQILIEAYPEVKRQLDFKLLGRIWSIIQH